MCRPRPDTSRSPPPPRPSRRPWRSAWPPSAAGYVQGGCWPPPDTARGPRPRTTGWVAKRRCWWTHADAASYRDRIERGGMSDVGQEVICEGGGVHACSGLVACSAGLTDTRTAEAHRRRLRATVRFSGPCVSQAGRTSDEPRTGVHTATLADDLLADVGHAAPLDPVAVARRVGVGPPTSALRHPASGPRSRSTRGVRWWPATTLDVASGRWWPC